MAVVWIVESPSAGVSRMAGALCGLVAVRAFASVRSMMQVAACEPIPAGASPRLILIEESQAGAPASREHHIREIQQVLDRNGWQYLSVLIAPPSTQTLVEQIRGILTIVPQLSPDFRQRREGDLLLDLDSRKVSCISCGQHEVLSPTETRLLRHFMERRDEVTARSELMSVVWHGAKVAPRSLDAHVSRLRKRVAFTGVMIEPVYGDGYRLSTGTGCEAASGRMAASRGDSTGVGRAAPRT